MNLGMKGFHPAVEHLGEAGKVGNVAYRESGLAQSTRGTAGRNQFNVHGAQLPGELHQACFVGDTQQRPFHLLIFHCNAP
jgi:hypothetical protein